MGNCNFQSDKPAESSIAIGRNMFQFHYVIGRGGFGKVWKVEKKNSKQFYALKEMSKARIIAKRSERSVMNERRILAHISHPFIINMSYAFQDRDNLYLVMDLLTGGDLRYHFPKRRKFTEVETKFFIACIVIGLEYVHSNGIIHRDIKPENLVFDSDGYLRITDFGIARVWTPENSHDTSGTPGYMAPEVMCRQNHGVAADYFAVGVIAYECMLGKRPYQGKTRKDIREQILAKQAAVRLHELPDGWSIEAMDFINRLLQRKPSLRLGLNGPDEVKKHPWLKNFVWCELYERRMLAPYIPNCRDDNFDAKYANDNKKEVDEAVIQSAVLLRDAEVQAQFADYYYDYSVPTPKTDLVALSEPNKKPTEGESLGPVGLTDVHVAVQ